MGEKELRSNSEYNKTPGNKSSNTETPILDRIQALVADMELQIFLLDFTIDGFSSLQKPKYKQLAQEARDRKMLLTAIVEGFKNGNPNELIAYAGTKAQDLKWWASHSHLIVAEKRANLAASAQWWSEIAVNASRACSSSANLHYKSAVSLN